MRKKTVTCAPSAKRFVRIVAGLALSLGLALPIQATATERTDLLVGIKTLPMLSHELLPPLVLGIVYDPANPESKNDAEAMKAVLDSGMGVQDGRHISGLMVPVANLAGLSQVKMVFIAKGLRSHFDAIAEAAKAHNILTMSSDMECVRENKCILGISSEPVVEIYFSRVASELAKIDFDAAFIMLIKKV